MNSPLGGASSFRALAKKAASHAAEDAEPFVSRVLPKAVNAARHRAAVRLSSTSKALVAQGVKDWKAGELVPSEISRFAAGSVTGIVSDKILEPTKKINWLTVLKEGVTDGVRPEIFPEPVG